MQRVVNRKQVVWTIFSSVVVLGLIGWWLSARGDFEMAISYLRLMDMPKLLWLIPVFILMWYTAGMMWFPYLSQDGIRNRGLLASIEYEINFVNTMVPFLSISGLVYTVARLKKFGISEGKATALSSFRYMISISTKWIEIAIALIILVALGKTGEMPTWTLWIAGVMCIAIIVGFTLGLIALKKAHKLLFKFKDGTLRTQLNNFLKTWDLVSQQKSALAQSFCWGLMFSLLEVAPFWVVAAAMGRPDLLLQVIVASGMAMAVGIVIPTPMGIGGFDGAMILFLGSMDSNVALVSAIVVATRCLVLGSTAIFGLPFWAHGMREIKEE